MERDEAGQLGRVRHARGVLGRASAHERSGRRCQADVVARRAPDRVRPATTDDSTIHLVSPLGGAERRLGDFRGADSLDWSPDGKWLAAGNSGQLNFGYLVPVPAPRWQGTARHLPGFRRRRRRAATDCLERESCRFEAGLLARRPAPRVCLLRLFRCGHGRDAGLRCGSGRTRHVARHGAASPPADDAAVPVIPSLAWTRDGSAIIYAAPVQTSFPACGA